MFSRSMPSAWFRSLKNFWLKMKATPEKKKYKKFLEETRIFTNYSSIKLSKIVYQFKNSVDQSEGE
jgi:hypothetical protein